MMSPSSNTGSDGRGHHCLAECERGFIIAKKAHSDLKVLRVKVVGGVLQAPRDPLSVKRIWFLLVPQSFSYLFLDSRCVYHTGCPYGRFSPPHTATLELCKSHHMVLRHLPDPGPAGPEVSTPAFLYPQTHV